MESHEESPLAALAHSEARSGVRWILANLEELLTAMLLAVMIGSVGLSVFCRSILQIPLSWTEEVVLLCMVWTCFLGASIAFVLYGFIASTSVARLFLGGIIPGILMGLFLMAAAWGATATPIPMPEVFTGLQSGIVEGQENPFPQILSQRFYEVQKRLILTAHITQTGSIIFNERLFQQQPKEHQQALVEASQGAMDWFLEYLTAQEGKMLDQLKGYGMNAVEPDRAAFREAMRPLYEKYDSIWTREFREKIHGFR